MANYLIARKRIIYWTVRAARRNLWGTDGTLKMLSQSRQQLES
jgi:hypothetical protein